jgi:hypothetical protein
MWLRSGDKFSELLERRAGNDVSSRLVGRVVELASVSELAEPGRGGSGCLVGSSSRPPLTPSPQLRQAASRQAALPSPTEGEEAMWVEPRMGLAMVFCRAPNASRASQPPIAS